MSKKMSKKRSNSERRKSGEAWVSKAERRTGVRLREPSRSEWDSFPRRMCSRQCASQATATPQVPCLNGACVILLRSRHRFSLICNLSGLQFAFYHTALHPLSGTKPFPFPSRPVRFPSVFLHCAPHQFTSLGRCCLFRASSGLLSS